MAFVLIGLVFGIISLAAFIDWRRARNNNQPHKSTHPGARPGESSNYVMGSHRDNGGNLP